MARVTAQKRKLQRDVEEQTEQAETTQRELEQLRSKLRTGGDKARSVYQFISVYRLWAKKSGYSAMGVMQYLMTLGQVWFGTPILPLFLFPPIPISFCLPLPILSQSRIFCMCFKIQGWHIIVHFCWDKSPFSLGGFSGRKFWIIVTSKSVKNYSLSFCLKFLMLFAADAVHENWKPWGPWHLGYCMGTYLPICFSFHLRHIVAQIYLGVCRSDLSSTDVV